MAYCQYLQNWWKKRCSHGQGIFQRIKRGCLAILMTAVDTDIVLAVNHCLDFFDTFRQIDHVMLPGEANACCIEPLHVVFDGYFVMLQICQLIIHHAVNEWRGWLFFFLRFFMSLAIFGMVDGNAVDAKRCAAFLAGSNQWLGAEECLPASCASQSLYFLLHGIPLASEICFKIEVWHTINFSNAAGRHLPCADKA